MRFGKTAGVLAAVVLASGLVIGASPAQAATSSYSAEITLDNPLLGDMRFLDDCGFPGAYFNPIQYDLVPFKVGESGTYTFSGTAVPEAQVEIAVFDGVFSAGACVGGGRDSASATLTAGTSYLLGVWLCPKGACVTNFLGTYTITANGPGAVNWPRRSSAAPSPDWVQGYGRASADETCTEGWSPSWDYWVNDGNGGWVCVRSVPEFGTE
jgi:hypothetical protein